MEFDFLYWTAFKVFGAMALIAGFVWYFYNHFKKKGTLPKSAVPYVMIVVLVTVYTFGMVRINPPEAQQRIIKTYDTQQVYEVPEIKLQTKQIYKPTTEQ